MLKGASTLENTDYDMAWDATPLIRQDKIYGTGPSSRRSSIRSFPEHHLSNAKSYGSFSKRGRSGSRAPQRLRKF
nr:AEL_HP1_G0051610.mRNA.1.CDS.1 [Saccharomyces cerevisiae]